jgi:hypothetical protein
MPSWQVVGWTLPFTYSFYFNNFYSACLVLLNWIALLFVVQSRAQISYRRPTVQSEVFFCGFIRLHVVQRLWMSGFIPPFPLYAFIAYFTFTFAYCLYIMSNSLLTNLPTTLHIIVRSSVYLFCEELNNNNNNCSLLTEFNPSFSWDYLPINSGVWTTDSFVNLAIAINA